MDVLIGVRGFWVYTGNGLDGCGVGVGVALLSYELEPSEDGILMGSLGVNDFCPTLVFLFFGKEEGIIGWSFFC